MSDSIEKNKDSFVLVTCSDSCKVTFYFNKFSPSSVTIENMPNLKPDDLKRIEKIRSFAVEIKRVLYND
jgi:hypothetical protein